jgi:hypothetical protein
MKFFYALLIASAVGLGSARLAASQNANNFTPSVEAIETAKEVLSFTSSSDMLNEAADKITAQLWPSMAKNLRAKYPNFEVDEAEMQVEFKRIFVSTIGDAIAITGPAMYARMFSVPEMRDLIAFYRTPTGSKFLKQQSQIAAETVAITQAALPGMLARINTAFEAIMRKHGDFK